MSVHSMLSEAAILHYASAETFRAGRACYEYGAVVAPVLYGTTLLAEVTEDAAGPFLVCCRLQVDGALTAACTCQYAWGGWCKHRVAACLVLLYRPEQVKERQALDHLLEGYSQQELRTLIVTLAGRIPQLAEAIDQHAMARLAVTPQPPFAAPTSARVPAVSSVDTRTVRREVQTVMHSLDHMRSSEAYWHAMRPGERRRFVLRERLAALPPSGHRRLWLASLPAVAASERRSRLSFQRMPCGRVSAGASRAGAPGRTTPVWPQASAARFAACARPASTRRSRLSFHSMLVRWWARLRALPAGH
jgi:hypothetical protein